MRNPLHVLKSSVGMLLDVGDFVVDMSRSGKREVAADVVGAIDRMEGTVNDVLDFRKLDANMFVMARKETLLLSLIDSVCRHCRPFLPRSVEFGYRVSPPNAEVMIDSRRMFQIITNGLR